MVKTIIISNIVDSFVTNEQGAIVFKEINQVIENEGSVTISMEGVDVMTSSFLNSSIVPLTDTHSFEWFKKNIKIINGRKRIIEMIKDRIKFAYTGKSLINN